MPQSSRTSDPHSLGSLFAEYEALLCRHVSDPRPGDRAHARKLGEKLRETCSPDALFDLHAAALRRCAFPAQRKGMMRAAEMLNEATSAFIKDFQQQSEKALQEAESFRRYAQVLEELNQQLVNIHRELQTDHEALRRDHAEQIRLSQQKTDLLSLVGHEIRTPLTALLGYGEFLEEGTYGPLNPEQEEILHRMIQSGRDLLQLINNLLDLSKLEAGKLRLDREPTSLHELTDHVVHQLLPLAQRKGLQLADSELPLDLPPVWVDPTRIIQVLVNLLGNAIKFTEKGGTITIGATVKGKMIELWVRDSGIGISPEAQAQLFQRYTQIENVRRYGGTGLGLSISKELITMHGGTIAVDSEPGKGATFRITLPIWDEQGLKP